jgi:hypothetical protein
MEPPYGGIGAGLALGGGLIACQSCG